MAKKIAEAAEEKKRYIRPIEEGTALDHLPINSALIILKVLDVKDTPMTAAIRVPSRKMGRKDLVFLEHYFLSKKEKDKIALIAPNATLNMIRGCKVVHKEELSLPDKVEDIVTCINPNCITNHESIGTKFYVYKNPLRVKCHYCEKIMAEKEFRERIK